MIDLARGSERRRARRVAIRGRALLFDEDGVSHGTIVDLSLGGALIRMLGPRRTFANADVFFLHPSTARTSIDELDLDSKSGWARARAVRVQQLDATEWQIAVAFERVEEPLRVAIDRAVRLADQQHRPGRPALPCIRDLPRR